MVQIHRTVLDPNKAFFIAIQKIFGVGRTSGLIISEACGISKDMKVRDVKESYIQKVAQYIQDNHKTGDQLKREIRENILTYVNNGSRRGMRHTLGKPIKERSAGGTPRMRRYLDLYDTSK